MASVHQSSMDATRPRWSPGDALDDASGCQPWVTGRDDCGVDVAANLMFWAPIGAHPTPSQRAQLQRALTTRVEQR